MSFFSKLMWMTVVVVICVVLDQASKLWAIDYFSNHEPIYWFGGLWQMFLTTNYGAMLGLGNQLSEELRFMIFNIGVSVFLVFATGYSLLKFDSRTEIVCAAMLVAGGGSNVYDRVMQNGGVTDFLFMDFFGLARTGVFNVADMFIMAAVIIFIIRELLVKKAA